MRTILSIAAATLAIVTAAHADIFQWEYINPADPSQGKQQSTTLCPDGAGAYAGRVANLSYRDLTMAYLIGANLRSDVERGRFTNLTATKLNQADLRDANFEAADLTNADLTGADIRGASFNSIEDQVFEGYFPTYLSNANFREANLTNASFVFAWLTGANFGEANLTNVNFGGAFLTGTNLREANLANAYFVADFDRCAGCPLSHAKWIGADLTAADARGAFTLNPSDAITTNLIWPDGHVIGLDLDVGALLVVRDYDGDPAPTDVYGTPTPIIPPIPITVDQYLSMGPGGTLRMVFEADSWDSTISFAPGIPVTLGGTLELTFATNVNPASQLGRTFDLFNWTGVNPTGVFTVSSPYRWDLSHLYATGEVTLTGIPEPTSMALLIFGTAGWYPRRRSTAS